MMKQFFAILVLFSLFSAISYANGLPPDQLTRNTANQVLSILRENHGITHNEAQIQQLVDEQVLPYFDFQRMTQLAMGRNWRRATPTQQEELVSQFRKLLVRTYSSALKSYRNQTITYLPFHMAPEDTDALVKTQINQPGQQPVPVDYSLEKTGQGWKVYDIAVDGVSLVTNYRSSFNMEIQRNGVEGLITALTKKNQAS
ncbi:MAG TPA: ABC transporter substrate-binding protein [Burkholderiales bacterium]|nr:ABC transporter substrate-binding protein [Burkholderiales bacterium]